MAAVNNPRLYIYEKGKQSYWPDAVQAGGFTYTPDPLPRSARAEIIEERRRYPKGRVSKYGSVLIVQAHPGVSETHGSGNPTAGKDVILVGTTNRKATEQDQASLDDLHNVLAGLGGIRDFGRKIR